MSAMIYRATMITLSSKSFYVLMISSKPLIIISKRYTRNFEKILEEVGLAASAEQCSQLCIPEGSYRFTIKVHADGLCCEHGNGQFKYFIDGVLKGSYRMKKRDSKKISFAIKKG